MNLEKQMELDLNFLIGEIESYCKSIVNEQNRVRCNAALYWLKKIDLSLEDEEDDE